jgi:hypothetical protein
LGQRERIASRPLWLRSANARRSNAKRSVRRTSTPGGRRADDLGVRGPEVERDPVHRAAHGVRGDRRLA